MVGRPDSITKRQRKKSELMDELYAKAVALYQEEHGPGVTQETLGRKPHSLRKICIIVETEHYKKTKKSSPKHLSSSTLRRLVRGDTPKSLCNSSRSWLLQSEEGIVIDYALELASRGFPLTHQRLKEIVDKICRARLGVKFPEEGVGRNWTSRFVEKHSRRLKMFWSSNLDTKRGRAVNPFTNKEYFELLKEVLEGRKDHEFLASDIPWELELDWEGIPMLAEQPGDVEIALPETEESRKEAAEGWEDDNENEEIITRGEGKAPRAHSEPIPIDRDCVYGADESGFNEDDGAKIRVIGARSKKMQHKQGGGGRENTTVIVTICADGTTIRPTVIFKGKHFQINWYQDNPTKAIIGHSEKGWTDGEIGVAWIKDFHEQTKEKAQGRTRLLLVDGHNSHYTAGFLRFAQAHRIHVLCYPAHGTHVYQGLDVVLFKPLKQYWREAKEKLFREKHQQIKKSNFLMVYGEAHLRALTPGNIMAAFEKTGVWPFNPNVITLDMMAPSKDTSSTGSLPVPEPSPVRAVSNLMQAIQKRQAENSPPSTPSSRRTIRRTRLEDPQTPSRTRQLDPDEDVFMTPLLNGIDDLRKTSTSFLVSSSPIRSATATLPRMPTFQISPIKLDLNAALLRAPPSTVREELLLELRKMTRKYNSLKETAISLQSSLILNSVYCDTLHERLAAQEETKKRVSKARLMGDGMPKLLTSEEFVKRVEDFAKESEEKAKKLQDKQASKEEVAAAKREWMALCEARKKENERLHEMWVADKALWREEKSKGVCTRPEPKWGSIKLALVPKPAILEKPSKKQPRNLDQGPVEDYEDRQISGSDHGSEEE
ncbi:hypothetical protein D9758_012308 [Tetrapyrgos nigripes]|uniref:HTH CENPB-type domain-containing protein n=1 Tax=Tetrapyrgos nigripes TaxID=182062 RepID=A0A8H5CM22_9AGAR|nr:hypothetical protein D9758_012308 [Tetrapyrgos nigripes]